MANDDFIKPNYGIPHCKTWIRGNSIIAHILAEKRRGPLGVLVHGILFTVIFITATVILTIAFYSWLDKIGFLAAIAVLIAGSVIYYKKFAIIEHAVEINGSFVRVAGKSYDRNHFSGFRCGDGPAAIALAAMTTNTAKIIEHKELGFQYGSDDFWTGILVREDHLLKIVASLNQYLHHLPTERPASINETRQASAGAQQDF